MPEPPVTAADVEELKEWLENVAHAHRRRLESNMDKALLRMVRAVLEIHEPRTEEGHSRCSGCEHDADGYLITDWPCENLAAMVRVLKEEGERG